MKVVDGPTSKAFQVWVVNGCIHSGYDRAADATTACQIFNQKAQTLGITARYEVRGKDEG